MSCIDFRLIDYNYAFADQTDIFVSSEAASFPKENLKQYSRSKVFRTSSVVGTQYIMFDLKTTEEIDSFVLFFNPVDGPKFSPAAVLTLQAAPTNVWTSPAVSVPLSFDENNESVSHFFTTDEAYRYWRLKIVDPMNTWGYFEIPKIVLGRKIQLTRIPEIGFDLEIEDLSTVDKTQYGHKYFDVYPNRKTISFDYNVMIADNLKLLADSFALIGRVGPVVVSVDSTELMFDKDDFIIYGTYVDQIKSKHIFGRYFKLPMSIEEMF